MAGTIPHRSSRDRQSERAHRPVFPLPALDRQDCLLRGADCLFTSPWSACIARGANSSARLRVLVNGLRFCWMKGYVYSEFSGLLKNPSTPSFRLSPRLFCSRPLLAPGKLGEEGAYDTDT